jgi:hypothetical protein
MESYNFEPTIEERLKQSYINHGQPFTVMKGYKTAGRKVMNALDIMKEHQDIIKRVENLEEKVRRNER